MKKTVVLAIAFVVLVLIVIVYTTIGTNRYKCEVCVAFHGRTACRIAAASTQDHALRTATENACAEIASGVTDSMACDSRPPTSVIWVTRK